MFCDSTTARHALKEMCSLRCDHRSGEVQYGRGSPASLAVAPETTISAIALADKKICGIPWPLNPAQTYCPGLSWTAPTYGKPSSEYPITLEKLQSVRRLEHPQTKRTLTAGPKPFCANITILPTFEMALHVTIEVLFSTFDQSIVIRHFEPLF